MKPTEGSSSARMFEIGEDEFSRARMGATLAGSPMDKRIETKVKTSSADRGTAHAVVAGNMALIRAITEIPHNFGLNTNDLRSAATETVNTGVAALYGTEAPAEASA